MDARELKQKLIDEILKPHKLRAEELIDELLNSLDHSQESLKLLNTHKCFECDEPADHLHHVVPRSMGGKNMIPLCYKCHGRVHSTLLSKRSLVLLGLQRAKDRGIKLGRPRNLDQKNEDLVAKMISAGASYRRIAAQTGASFATIARIKNAIKLEETAV